LALQLGASYVGRSFSGDKKQLVPLIKGALTHGGTALLDVISPCVAFNNHDGSTKSYDYVREHNEAVNEISFRGLDVIEPRAPITADLEPGADDDVIEEIRSHDGSLLRLRKLAARYRPDDRAYAMQFVQERSAAGEIVTGLLYVDADAQDLHARLNTVAVPLNDLCERELCPGRSALEKFNAAHR